MKWIKQIQRSHEQSRFTYGSPRVTVDLKDQGMEICENTVAKLMRRQGSGREGQTPLCAEDDRFEP